MNPLSLIISTKNELMLHRWYYTIIALALVVSFFSKTIILSFLVLGTIITILLPLGKKGIFTKAVIVFVLAASVNMIIGFIFWVLKIPVTTQFLSGFYTVVACILVYRHKSRKVLENKIFPIEDIVSLTVCLITTVFLLLTFFAHTDNSSLFRVIGMGVDNIAHIGILRLVDGNNGYIYGNKQIVDKEMLKNISAYPQGLHLNMALVENVVWPSKGLHSNRQTMLFYIIYYAFQYALLAYMFCFIALSIAKKLKVWSKMLTPILATFFTLFLFTNLLLDIYVLGFLTQIFSLLVSMVLLIILVDALEASKKNKFYYLSLALLLCAGAGFSYVFMLPVLLVSVLLTGAYLLAQRKLAISARKATIFIVMAAIAIAPVIIQTIYMGKLSKLNEQGGALKMDIILLTCFAGLAFLYYFIKQKRFKQVYILQLLLLISSSFVAAIFLYQKITVGGESTYFLYKATYLPLIIIILAICLFFMEAAKPLIANWQIILMSICLILFFWQTRTQTFMSYATRTAYRFSPGFASTINKLSSDPNYQGKSTKIISLGNNCRLDDDLYLMRFVTAFSGEGDLDQAQMAQIAFYPDQRRQALYDLIKKYQAKQADKRLIIVTSSNKIRQDLIEKLGENAKYIEFIKPIADNPPVPTYCES